MNDDNEKTNDSSTTRRNALKAGVGFGVGVAAWSAPSITSLGGTPVYAAGCTFVQRIVLSGCRNTDQGACKGPGANTRFGYHTLSLSVLPSGYSLENAPPESTCCAENWTAVLKFPAGITCNAVVRFAAPGNCSGAVVNSYVEGPSSTGSLPIQLRCVTNAQGQFPSNTQYTIIANCNTTGAPIECLN